MTGQPFPEVDLSEGEWNDYDEKVGPWFYDFYIMFILLSRRLSLSACLK